MAQRSTRDAIDFLASKRLGENQPFTRKGHAIEITSLSSTGKPTHTKRAPMPKLLIVRHAIAQDRDEALKQRLPDAERPLTGKGKKRMRRVAAGLRHAAGPLGLILSSPLRRAQQTAAILQDEYPDTPLTLSDTLSPGQSVNTLATKLAETGNPRTLAVIGHEPDLSQLIATLLCGQTGAAIQLKKGGAALLTFTDRIASGQGRLLWLLTPGQLRTLGR